NIDRHAHPTVQIRLRVCLTELADETDDTRLDFGERVGAGRDTAPFSVTFEEADPCVNGANAILTQAGREGVYLGVTRFFKRPFAADPDGVGEGRRRIVFEQAQEYDYADDDEQRRRDISVNAKPLVIDLREGKAAGHADLTFPKALQRLSLATRSDGPDAPSHWRLSSRILYGRGLCLLAGFQLGFDV